MTSGMLETLKISEDKKKYIAEKLNPVLEEMVTECLSSLPANPVDFMVEYMSKKIGEGGGSKPAGGDADLAKQNEELKKQVADMTTKVAHAGEYLAATAEEEKEEEEEEDD